MYDRDGFKDFEMEATVQPSKSVLKPFALGVGGLVVFLLATAILIPVFTPPFVDGPGGPCISNKRMLASSVMMYAADNDDRLPVDPTSQYGAVGWAERIKPYTVHSRLVCPASSEKVSYAMNLNLASVGSIEAVGNPERVVILFEVSGGSLPGPAGSGAAGDLYDSPDACRKELYYATGNLSNSRLTNATLRHGGKSSMAFLDSHASYVLPESISAGRSALSANDIEDPSGMIPRAEGTEVGWHKATFSVK